MSGTCSFHTAQQFMHAMQVVHAQISFSVMTSPTSLGALVAVLGLQSRLDHVLLDFLNDLLRLERVAGSGRRTRAVAASALGAGETAQQLFPSEFLPAGGAGGEVFLRPEHVQVARRTRGALAEEHVERRGQQVEMLRIRQINKEEQHADHVQPPHAVGQARGRSPAASRQRASCSRLPTGAQAETCAAFAHDAEGRAEERAQHEQANQPEDQVRVEAQVQMRWSEEQPSGHRHAERDQHQHREDLEKQADDLDFIRIRNRQKREQPAHQAPVEAGRIEDEAPEDEEVRQADAALVEDARLQQDVFDDVSEPPAELIEAVFVASLPQQADQLPHPVAKDPKGHEREQPRAAACLAARRMVTLTGSMAVYPLRALTLSVRSREHLQRVAHHAVMCPVEDGRLGIGVDGDDALRVLHSFPMLRRAADAEGEIDPRLDGHAGLADLAAQRQPALVDHRP